MVFFQLNEWRVRIDDAQRSIVNDFVLPKFRHLLCEQPVKDGSSVSDSEGLSNPISALCSVALQSLANIGEDVGEVAHGLIYSTVLEARTYSALESLAHAVSCVGRFCVSWPMLARPLTIECLG